MKVAVLGARGRMGARVCASVAAAGDLELVATLDRGDDLGEVVRAGAEVAVDFTVPQATEGNVHAMIDAGVHSVVGTSGWSEPALGRVREHLARKPTVGVVVAPNFALSAVLAMRFAAEAAGYFESAEVVEMHHPDKVDAPSGTAVHTARAVAASRRRAGLPPAPDATAEAVDGARGADIDGVRVHAVRIRGMVAHEEIIFGNPGELLTIRADSFDRASFMPGVLLAIRAAGRTTGLTLGLDRVLDLAGGGAHAGRDAQSLADQASSRT